MTFLKYIRKSLLFRKTGNLLSVILISVSIAILWMAHESERQAEEHLRKNLAETDLVVGAKGSPLQLILSCIFHIDAPTGNILYSEAKKLSRNRMIQLAVPVSLGDNFNGFRIVGTDSLFPRLYAASLAEGRLWSRPMEVCLGALTAEKAGLKTGDHFHGAHGMDEAGDPHGDYVVTGVFLPTGTVLDQLIVTSLESVWEVHTGHEEKHEHQEVEYEEDSREITALLVKYRMPMAAIQLPRYINENTAMQAAAPAIEINRLYHLLNIGSDVLTYFGYALFLLAWISILISFLKSLEERKFELALLRSLGASYLRIIAFLMGEYFLLTLTGWLCGEIIGRLGLSWLGTSLNYGMAYHFNTRVVAGFDLVLLVSGLIASGVAILLPVRKIFRLSIPELLSSR